MAKAWMICGADCHQGDSNCNGYCIGKADEPPTATEAQVLAAAEKAAHGALDAAAKAWFEYAALCDVGPKRTWAFQVYENLQHARRAWP